MRVVLSVGALLCFGISSAHEGKEPKPKERIPPAFNDLALSEAQKADILKIHREYGEAIRKLEQEIAKLKAEQIKKRLAVLSEEQRKKLKEAVGTPEPPAKDKKEQGDR